MASAQDDPRLKAIKKGSAKAIREFAPNLVQSVIPGASTVVKLLDSTAPLFLQGFSIKKKQDLDYFLAELARRTQDDGIEFSNEFLTSAYANEHLAEVMAQATNALLEITNSEILAALAHITYHYKVNDKAPDLFFHSFTSFLKRVGQSDISQIREALEKCQDIVDKSTTPPPMFFIGHERNEPFNSIVSGSSNEDSFESLTFRFSLALEGVLIGTGLAMEWRRPRLDSPGLREGMCLERSSVEGLATYLLKH